MTATKDQNWWEYNWLDTENPFGKWIPPGPYTDQGPGHPQLKLNPTPKDRAKQILAPNEDDLLREKIYAMTREELLEFVEQLLFGK